MGYEYSAGLSISTFNWKTARFILKFARLFLGIDYLFSQA